MAENRHRTYIWVYYSTLRERQTSVPAGDRITKSTLKKPEIKQRDFKSITQDTHFCVLKILHYYKNISVVTCLVITRCNGTNLGFDHGRPLKMCLEQWHKVPIPHNRIFILFSSIDTHYLFIKMVWHCTCK